jgi:hypothetical protein
VYIIIAQTDYNKIDEKAKKMEFGKGFTKDLKDPGMRDFEHGKKLEFSIL